MSDCIQKNIIKSAIILLAAISLQIYMQIYAIYLEIYSFVVTAFFAFFALPVLALILLNIPLKNAGLRFGRLPKNKLLIISTIIILIAVFIACLLPESQEYYSNKIPKNNVILFVIAVYTILYGAEEFFFRGFILFGLEPWLGKYANLAQAIPFFIFHITKPPTELFLSLFAGLIFGKIALESRSFIIPFILHWSLGLAVFVTLSVI